MTYNTDNSLHTGDSQLSSSRQQYVRVQPSQRRTDNLVIEGAVTHFFSVSFSSSVLSQHLGTFIMG